MRQVACGKPGLHGVAALRVIIRRKERMSMVPTLQQDFVLKTIEKRDVHFVRLWFTDVLGTMKSFSVMSNELPEAFANGMCFDGSCIEGFCHAQESEMLAFPDASTFQILPWRPDSNAVARMFCTICRTDKTPFDSDPREVLARSVAEAQKMGYTLMVAPELEFYYFKDETDTQVLDRGGFFDLTSRDYASDLRRDTVLALEKMGIPVKYSYHESGPSQHEIDLRPADALSMADAVMTYKLVVKEIALTYGVHASFMPKPCTDIPGSGMHLHHSLFHLDGTNAFYDPHDPLGYGLSSTAKHFIAGLLKYAPEYAAVTNQYVNSYKRLLAGDRAPVELSWARTNLSTLVRVPSYRPQDASSSCIELRSPDAAANPYLVFAVILSAGLAGIAEKLPLTKPHEASEVSTVAQVSRHTLQQRLPQNLGEAIELFARSQLMRTTLGESVQHFLVEAKRAEWNEYQRHVSEWERERYFEVL